MTADRIKEYLQGGNTLYKVTKMDSYRDGGTKIIITQPDNIFYIDKNNWTIHSEYPTNSDNEIKGIEKEFIIHICKEYVQREIEKAERQRVWIFRADK